MARSSIAFAKNSCKSVMLLLSLLVHAPCKPPPLTDPATVAQQSPRATFSPFLVQLPSCLPKNHFALQFASLLPCLLPSLPSFRPTICDQMRSVSFASFFSFSLPPLSATIMCYDKTRSSAVKQQRQQRQALHVQEKTHTPLLRFFFCRILSCDE